MYNAAIATGFDAAHHVHTPDAQERVLDQQIDALVHPASTIPCFLGFLNALHLSHIG